MWQKSSSRLGIGKAVLNGFVQFQLTQPFLSLSRTQVILLPVREASQNRFVDSNGHRTSVVIDRNFAPESLIANHDVVLSQKVTRL